MNLTSSCALTGSPQELWQLHHVSLDVQKKFRVVFEGTKGASGAAPAGGLSLDDINLSETTCPEFIWRVKNFSHIMDNTPMNTPIFSPPFTSKEGYTFQMKLYPSGSADYPGELSAYANLVAREGDPELKWPCPWKQITMMLMDQHPHIQKRMSNQRSVTTDPNMMTATGASAASVKKIQMNCSLRKKKRIMNMLFLLRCYIYTPVQHSFKQAHFSGTTLARWALRSQMQGPSISEGQALAPQCISPTSEPRAGIL